MVRLRAVTSSLALVRWWPAGAAAPSAAVMAARRSWPAGARPPGSTPSSMAVTAPSSIAVTPSAMAVAAPPSPIAVTRPRISLPHLRRARLLGEPFSIKHWPAYSSASLIAVTPSPTAATAPSSSIAVTPSMAVTAPSSSLFSGTARGKRPGDRGGATNLWPPPGKRESDANFGGPNTSAR